MQFIVGALLACGLNGVSADNTENISKAKKERKKVSACTDDLDALYKESQSNFVIYSLLSCQPIGKNINVGQPGPFRAEKENHTKLANVLA